MEIDSKPEEMDKLERRLIQLKIEREAVKKESDEASKKRLQALQEEIGKLEKTMLIWKKYGKRKKRLYKVLLILKEELERVRLELETAHRGR